MTRKEQIEEVIKKLRPLVKYHVGTGTLYSLKTKKRYETKDSHGYVCFHALGKKWKVHRVIWFFEYGTLPPMIDHIDGNRENNHYSNLREVTPRQNSYNCIIKSNLSKYKGVWKSKSGRYRASITEHGKRTHLGYFNTAEEAAEIYNKALTKADPMARRNKLEKSDEVKRLESQLNIAIEALKKIEDPRLRDHKEPDKYTEVGCMMNMATEALQKINELGSEK